MEILQELVDDITVITPSGSLVASEISYFRKKVEELIVNNLHHILLDMNHINFIDSSGLDVIMTINKLLLNDSGSLVCAALKPNVLKIFKVTWADQKIPVADTRDDALLLLKKMKEQAK